ncbi:NUDIX domain-containing protein [Candidatus Poribacteria bacterium]|nr:NUDIX domain-containing protein [Candidatus Poribacteria bacterium]
MSDKTEEYFDIVDENDNVIGKASRSQCHGDNSLAHRVVHVLVFNSKGQLFLQKRSKNKFIQPGKWDTSVGGHLDSGETYDQAVKREMKEELGIIAPVKHVYNYWMCNDIETEYVQTYICIYDGNIEFDPDEIDEGRFWTKSEIESNLGKDIFTPNFEEEYQRYLDWINSVR